MKKILIIGRGYIGSFLKDNLVHKYDIFTLDYLPIGIDSSKDIQSRFQDIDDEFLKKFKVVLFFAGVSSVPLAIKDDISTINNNTIDLFELAKKCSKFNIKLIYASSGSIFSSSEDLNFTANETIYNSYDASKLAFDLIVNYSRANFIGLRLATVSGWSRVMRNELIFNAMCLSAIEKKIVNVSNGDAFRSILFLSDLSLIILKLLELDELPNKTISCSSYSGSILQIGNEIASFFDVPVNIENKKTTSYSFVLKKSEFDSTTSSLNNQIKRFVDMWRLSYEKK